jgi:NAD(P)H-nitrite reductase large subunit
VTHRWFASSVDFVVRRMNADPIVVVGAGMAGGRATDAMMRNADRPVFMLGTERLPPYNRPDLSKYVRDGLVTGGATLDADRSASRLMKIMRATPALKIDNSLIEQLLTA